MVDFGFIVIMIVLVCGVARWKGYICLSQTFITLTLALVLFNSYSLSEPQLTHLYIGFDMSQYTGQRLCG